MKKIFQSIFLAICIFCLAGCTNNSILPEKTNITVTLLNGEYYTVVGNNQKEVVLGQPIEFEVNLTRGYEIVGAYGNKCTVTNNLGFKQTVTFTDIAYKSTLRLETSQMQVSEFTIKMNDMQAGNINIETKLGEASGKAYYTKDSMNISIKLNDGYRFQGWSTKNFLNANGNFYSYDLSIDNFDFNYYDTLYANFKNMADTGNEIFYIMGNGLEIEQDCLPMVEHHPRANTLTVSDLREKGIDCDSKMLIGWETQDGQYVGLGSRVAINNETATFLYPIWKDYNDVNDFIYEQTLNGEGRIIKYVGGNTEQKEIIIPNKINGLRITSIASNAFEQCESNTYYLPDTIATVEENAFLNCKNLNDLYMSDNIMEIDDKSFAGCENFTTLHINAILKPRYSDGYYAAKMDVFDRLAADVNNDKKKLIVIGGSSVANGYSGAKVKEVLNQYGFNYDFYNLGLNATFNNFIQYEVAEKYLNAGDIYIHAPESAYEPAWGGAQEYSPITGELALNILPTYQMLTMFESNWQFISNISINKYSDFFASWKLVNQDRISLPESNYMAYYPITTVGEGMRQTGEYVKNECGDSDFFNSSAYAFMDPSDKAKLASENIYTPLADKGVQVFNTFPPLAIQVLLNWYGGEVHYNYAAELYTQRVSQSIDLENVVVLLNHKETLYDASHFSDHCMHLGYDYQLIHTEKIITALAEHLIGAST